MFKETLLVLLAFLIVSFSSCQPEAATVPEWPEQSQTTKPWTRWWWLGSSVDKEGLTTAMESYSKAGIGGLEITPIYGIKGKEETFLSFISDEWNSMLQHTLNEAGRLDMGIDMALASGWPFGGPWVNADNACKYIEFKTFGLKGGQSLEERISLTQKPMVRTVGKRVPIESLSDPVSSNDSLQDYAFDQVRFPRNLKLISLMAYSDSTDPIELTEKVGADGTLNWVSPDGDWLLIAVFEAFHGKMVERAGPGGEGDVIDHFSKNVLLNYLSNFDKAFDGIDLTNLRAFFNDSYEVDDAVGEANWTPAFFTEFEKRRGYDLKTHLPALLGLTSEEEQMRVICDYRQTISDLLLDNFTIPWQEWATKKTKKIRNQSHGSPANILDLYAASDIPETEGIDLLNIKFASSAAHITGKPLIAAEAATWLDEHFKGTLAASKQNIDRYFLGGVNHIVYHGTPYSPVDEPWPGNLFYASCHYAPTNTFWVDFPSLNNYVSRVQSFLQKSKPDNDILLYYPVFDQWMSMERTSIPHFHGNIHGSESEKIAEKLVNSGYDFDYVSDKQIKTLSYANARIITPAKTTYKIILVPPLKYMPYETYEALVKLAQRGAKVIFQQQLPSDVPGLANYNGQLNLMRQLTGGLNKHKEVIDGLIHYNTKSGAVIVSNELIKDLNTLGLPYESLVENNLKFRRFRYNNTSCYFLKNDTDDEIAEWVKLNAPARNIAHFNPMTGALGKGKIKNPGTKDQLVFVHLKPGESSILQLIKNDFELDNYIYPSTTDDELTLSSKWTIEFTKGGPTLPNEQSNIDLKAWTSIDSEGTKDFSGTALYRTTFSIPDKVPNKWCELDLGEVHESAMVVLNNDTLGTLIGPDYSLVFESTLLKENNLLEVYVTNLMANRIAYMDRNSIPYRNFYNVNFAARLKENRGSDGNFTAINWSPLISGLIGPVKITPIRVK